MTTNLKQVVFNSLSRLYKQIIANLAGSLKIMKGYDQLRKYIASKHEMNFSSTILKKSLFQDIGFKNLTLTSAYTIF